MPELALSLAADHPAFAGHFPGNPIVPGVVLLDLALRALQTIGAIEAMTATATGPTVAPLELSVAKFLAPVRPGEALSLNYEMIGADCRFTLFATDAAPNDPAAPPRRVATGQLTRRSVRQTAPKTAPPTVPEPATRSAPIGSPR